MDNRRALRSSGVGLGVCVLRFVFWDQLGVHRPLPADPGNRTSTPRHSWQTLLKLTRWIPGANPSNLRGEEPGGGGLVSANRLGRSGTLWLHGTSWVLTDRSQQIPQIESSYSGDTTCETANVNLRIVRQHGHLRIVRQLVNLRIVRPVDRLRTWASHKSTCPDRGAHRHT